MRVPCSERSKQKKHNTFNLINECVESFGGKYNVLVRWDLIAKEGDDEV